MKNFWSGFEKRAIDVSVYGRDSKSKKPTGVFTRERMSESKKQKDKLQKSMGKRFVKHKMSDPTGKHRGYMAAGGVAGGALAGASTKPVSSYLDAAKRQAGKGGFKGKGKAALIAGAVGTGVAAGSIGAKYLRKRSLRKNTAKYKAEKARFSSLG